MNREEEKRGIYDATVYIQHNTNIVWRSTSTCLFSSPLSPAILAYNTRLDLCLHVGCWKRVDVTQNVESICIDNNFLWRPISTSGASSLGIVISCRQQSRDWRRKYTQAPLHQLCVCVWGGACMCVCVLAQHYIIKLGLWSTAIRWNKINFTLENDMIVRKWR